MSYEVALCKIRALRQGGGSEGQFLRYFGACAQRLQQLIGLSMSRDIGVEKGLNSKAVTWPSYARDKLQRNSLENSFLQHTAEQEKTDFRRRRQTS